MREAGVLGTGKMQQASRMCTLLTGEFDLSKPASGFHWNPIRKSKRVGTPYRIALARNRLSLLLLVRLYAQGSRSILDSHAEFMFL